MRDSLGDDYVDRLFTAFAGRVPAEADLVAYWFVKAWERMREGRLRRAGLVGTNSMRGGANRRVLDAIVKDGRIFNAWDDEKWVVKGVAVRVSLVCFSTEREEQKPQLDGKTVERIGSDLATSKSDVTTARRLVENRGVAFMGDTKGGAFDIPSDLARQWLQLPLNFGCLHARHLTALAEEMQLALVEVYEVASFYAHFDIPTVGRIPMSCGHG